VRGLIGEAYWTVFFAILSEDKDTLRLRRLCPTPPVPAPPKVRKEGPPPE
jgi:hypothetical protein